MAKLKEVVDECLAVATAFTSINSQTYNEIGAINYEDNDKTFPLFLFNKRNVEVVVDKYSRNNLPSKSTYSCNLLFLNTYTEAEKLTEDLQTKQDALMDIASQYFAELRQRNASGENGFHLGEITFNSLDETHSEQLVQLSYNVSFTLYVQDCSLGSFSYAGLDAPTSLVITASDETSITLGWTDNATSETNYEIYRSTDSTSFSLIDTIAADSTTYNDTGLTGGTAYIYKVRAITADSNGEFSNIALGCTDTTCVTPPQTYPSADSLKTGQTVSYTTGDDGDLEDGRDTDFLTLAINNPIGNSYRFTDELGGQTFTNDIIIDWATYDGAQALGWYRVKVTTGVDWAGTIAYGLGATLGTFSTWQMPNVTQWMSILNFGITSGNNKLNYVPFNNVNVGMFMSTTFNPVNTTVACFGYSAGLSEVVRQLGKTYTGTTQLFCRYFTNAELGI